MDNNLLYIVERSEVFALWFDKLKDTSAKKRILARLDAIETEGYFGEHRGVGDKVSELKFQFGAGYRIYYTIKDNVVVLLLCGGDKDSQQKDIERAKQILKELE